MDETNNEKTYTLAEAFSSGEKGHEFMREYRNRLAMADRTFEAGYQKLEKAAADAQRDGKPIFQISDIRSWLLSVVREGLPFAAGNGAISQEKSEAVAPAKLEKASPKLQKENSPGSR
jgi:hypothetical protein